jgi:ABC-2 type transport system permease protein
VAGLVVPVVRHVQPPSRLGVLWDSRRILALLVSRDLKVKYSDSILGYLWSIIDPMMLAGVYWFVFTKLMQRQVGDTPYIVFLLCAMLPWQWTNHVLRSSMKALSKDAKLVRSTNLPREIWVLRTVGSRGIEFLLSIPVLVLFAVLTHAHLTWYVVFAPLALLIQTVLLVGCGLLLAPVAVLFGDVERLVTVVMRLLFYLSPIIYGVHDIDKRYGSTAAHLYVLNPLAGIFDLYRASFFADQWAGWFAVSISALVAVVVFVAGALVFRRLEGAVLKEI